MVHITKFNSGEIYEVYGTRMGKENIQFLIFEGANWEWVNSNSYRPTMPGDD